VTAPVAHRPLGRRVAAVLAVAAVAGLAGAEPAAADPPRPTDYESVIESIEPAPDGVEVAIVGGDAFLELRVDEGHEVAVPGYSDEPYLRFLPDGTVERNRNAPTTWVNEDRYGDSDVPASATVDAEPDWERVAGGGEYAWHDHNIHWMGSGRPAGKGPGDVVQNWSLLLDVDGTETTVTGDLTWAHAVNPLPWAALGIAAAVAVGLLSRRAAARRGADDGPGAGPPIGAVAAVAGTVLALVAGGAQYADAPAGSGVSPLLFAVPLAGLVAGLAGLALRRRAPMVATAGSLAAVAAVVGWALLRLSVLWKPILPTLLPDAVDRSLTTLALGLAVAAAAVVVLATPLVPALPDDLDDSGDRDEDDAPEGAATS